MSVSKVHGAGCLSEQVTKGVSERYLDLRVISLIAEILDIIFTDD